MTMLGCMFSRYTASLANCRLGKCGGFPCYHMDIVFVYVASLRYYLTLPANNDNFPER